jgi:hypothetical protein
MIKAKITNETVDAFKAAVRRRVEELGAARTEARNKVNEDREADAAQIAADLDRDMEAAGIDPDDDYTPTGPTFAVFAEAWGKVYSDLNPRRKYLPDVAPPTWQGWAAEDKIAALERECKRLVDGPPTRHPPEFVAKVLMDREGLHDPMQLARLTEVIRCARLDGRKLARDHVAALEAENARLHDELKARTDEREMWKHEALSIRPERTDLLVEVATLRDTIAARDAQLAAMTDERDEAIADAVAATYESRIKELESERDAALALIEANTDVFEMMDDQRLALEVRIRELDDLLAQRPAPVPDPPKPVHDFTRVDGGDRRRLGR